MTDQEISLVSTLGDLRSDIREPAVQTGLSLPGDLLLSEWQSLGRQIHTISSASRWWLGDWLVFGQDKFPGRYKRAITETSLDYQTLRNYAWIARKFPRSRRRGALSFQHHVEVAALSVAEQDHWLEFAERLGWSRNELRKQVRASIEDERRREEPDEVHLRLSVNRDQIDRWEEAAHAANVSLVDWIGSVLTAAVQQPGPVLVTGSPVSRIPRQ